MTKIKDNSHRAAAGNILKAANTAVTTVRGEQHGPAKAQFQMAADFWATYIENVNGLMAGTITIDAQDVGMLLDLLKTTRVVHGDRSNADNYIDKAGYTALAGSFTVDFEDSSAVVADAATKAVAASLAPRPGLAERAASAEVRIPVAKHQIDPTGGAA